MKKLNILVVVLAGIALLLMALPAQAMMFEVDFTAINFATPPGHLSVPAPTDPVTGIILYEAASTTANIESLISINLTIDGHMYSLSEVGYISSFGGLPEQLIGGTLNGINKIFSGTNDFMLFWNKSTLVPSGLWYTSSSTDSIGWDSDTFTSFSVKPVDAVPEPTTMLLLGSGLIGLFGLRRKSRG